MEGSTVRVMLVGTEFPAGENMGRLLDEVPTEYRSGLTQYGFGSWLRVTLNDDQAVEAKRIGSPVVVLNVETMQVFDIVGQDTCREQVLRLPPSTEE